MESLKDKSAIVKIDTPALIKELTASSVESELDLRGVEVGEEQEKEEDVAEEVGSFRPREFLISGQSCRSGLVLNADHIAGFTRLEVGGGHVSQGVEGLLVQMACRGWRAVTGH